MRKVNISHYGIVPGQIVISKAGHDQGKIYAVVKVQADGVWLSDGRIRTLERPKFKKYKHIQKTLEVILQVPEPDCQNRLTNVHIFKAIKVYASKL